MKRYFIIQSQSPFNDPAAEQHYALAKDLVDSGVPVRMLLVQHGTTVAHQGTQNSAFQQLLSSDVELYADRFALHERQIQEEELHPGIVAADLDLVAEALLAGDKVIWH
ncbi:DsrE family protein [Parahaliea sp. F7430]|uniref:DsrE family protein n=1 Tax=Sediminihaliea albiluteola TaxID=2758564 RepID=A0A7W2YK85_9GAMM|nr:DsrE family protein [Sediminihaliea albiluteola]MBA6413887.1 DsrE family protein [Sediminihaliea albiluteola]